jgi:hypothetical protein
MTMPPETVEPAAPADPAVYGRRPRTGGLPLSVWALIAFGLICVLAGIAVANYGPRLWPAAPSPPASAAADPVAAPAAAPAPSAPLVGAPPLAEPSSPDFSSLEARLAALESDQGDIAAAAAAAVAASALSSAADSAEPFEAQVAALERLLPASTDLRALQRLAVVGAPSRAALQAGFADQAARAAIALREPAADAGLGARVGYALSSIVSIRRISSTTGSGPDAILARAETQAAEGDIEAALKTLAALPPGAAPALADWRAQAERRVEIDRRVSAVRDTALADLSRIARPSL